MVTKLLKGLVPAPLRWPIQRGVLSLIRPLRRRLTRTWRRRNRLQGRVRRRRNWLKVRLRRRRNRLERLWRKRLKPVWLHVRLLVWYWRTRNRPAESSNQIHLINPLRGFAAGSAMRTLNLYEELRNYCNDQYDISLWSEYEEYKSDGHSEIAEKYPVKQIVPERFEFPKTGTFVFVGTRRIPVGPWIRYVNPRRTILVHNSDVTPEEFRRRLWHISNGGRRKVEVAYASELMKRSVGNYPGFVQASLIDLDRFVPARSKAPSRFTVGRLSRAVAIKHHPDDATLYRRLVEEGCRVRIMGPSPSLKAELRGLEAVTLLPTGAEEAHLFLQGLDCFFYRTSENYLEAWGRVVTEAMACGLPVVCHNRGGYAEIIEHGRNGFLFESQQEALRILLGLKEDPVLRERVGKEARRTAEELFSSARRSKIVEFYLR